MYPGFEYLTSSTKNSIIPTDGVTNVIATSFNGTTKPSVTGKLTSIWWGIDSLYMTCVNNTATNFPAPIDVCGTRFTATRYDGSVVSQDFTITPTVTASNTYGYYTKVLFKDQFYSIKSMAISALSSSPAGKYLMVMDALEAGACAAPTGGTYTGSSRPVRSTKAAIIFRQPVHDGRRESIAAKSGVAMTGGARRHELTCN